MARKLVIRSGRVAVAVALGLACGGCNEVFDIEEGVPALRPYSGDAGPRLPDAVVAPEASGDAGAPAPQSATLVFHDWDIVPGVGGLPLSGGAYTEFSAGTRISPECPWDGPCMLTEQHPLNLCVSGLVDALPVNPDYGTYWGANLMVALTGSASQQPGASEGGRAIGVSFRVEGAQVPAELRFQAQPRLLPGEVFQTYCITLGRAGRFDVRFQEVLSNCWNLDGSEDKVPLSPSATLNAWGWNVVPQPFAVPFDFCISDIRLILAPE
jgi:hypothetical protein